MAHRVAIFQSLFSGRPDVYGTYDAGTVRQVKAAVTDQVILAHLRGEQPYGVYLLTGDRTSAVAVDFDRKELDLPVSFVAACRQQGLSAYMERSKSKGYHVWMFFERQGVLAYKARLVARKILADIGAHATEVFPKQDALEDGVSYGNFINAPLFGGLVPKGRTVFVDPAEPTRIYPDQWELLAGVRRHTEKDLDTVIRRRHWEVRDRPRAGHGPKAGPDVSAFGLLPCARQILAEGVSSYQRVSCFRLAVHLKRYGLPYDLALAVLKVWAKKNRPADGRRIITEREIEYQVRCAFDRPYRSFGCEQAVMVAYCHRECPLYRYTVRGRWGREGPCAEDQKGERDRRQSHAAQATGPRRGVVRAPGWGQSRSSQVNNVGLP